MRLRGNESEHPLDLFCRVKEALFKNCRGGKENRLVFFTSKDSSIESQFGFESQLGNVVVTAQ